MAFNENFPRILDFDDHVAEVKKEHQAYVLRKMADASADTYDYLTKVLGVDAKDVKPAYVAPKPAA